MSLIEIHTPQAIENAFREVKNPEPRLLDLWKKFDSTLEDWGHPWLARGKRGS